MSALSQPQAPSQPSTISSQSAGSTKSQVPSTLAAGDDPRRRPKWSAADKQMLTDLWAQGLSAEQIAKKMPGRTPASIQLRANRQNLPGRGRGENGSLVPRLPKRDDKVIDGERSWKLVTKMRRCLAPSCGKLFMSEHAGHRRCTPCAQNNEIVGQEDYSLHV